MKSGRFDCEIFQEADGNTAIYTVLFCMALFFDTEINKNT